VTITVTPVRVGRAVLWLLLAWWTWVFLTKPMRQDVIGASFLHLISLPFHEAGHLIFMPFGELMTPLGGSLNQVLVPIICAIAFLTTSWNPFGAAVMAWWAGQNLMDVAVYIDDARTLSLTLIGGHTGAEVEGHDWERILTLTNMLWRDHQIAWITHWIGAAIMIAALAWGAIITLRDPVEERP
jgi:hypothetical protein